MSLRKSPTLTPKMLAANRRNARRSTGPTTVLGFAGEDTRATEVAYARSLRGSMLARRENATDLLLRLKAREAAAGDAKNREMKEGPTMLLKTKDRLRNPTMLLKKNRILDESHDVIESKKKSSTASTGRPTAHNPRRGYHLVVPTPGTATRKKKNWERSRNVL